MFTESSGQPEKSTSLKNSRENRINENQARVCGIIPCRLQYIINGRTRKEGGDFGLDPECPAPKKTPDLPWHGGRNLKAHTRPCEKKFIGMGKQASCP